MLCRFVPDSYRLESVGTQLPEEAELLSTSVMRWECVYRDGLCGRLAGRLPEWAQIDALLRGAHAGFSDAPAFRSVSVSVIFAGINVCQEYGREIVGRQHGQAAARWRSASSGYRGLSDLWWRGTASALQCARCLQMILAFFLPEASI